MIKQVMVGFSSFMVAVLGGIIAASVSEVLKTHLTLFLVIFLIFAALFAIILGVRVGPTTDLSRTDKAFQTLWPKLSELLYHDIENSFDVATRCRLLKNGTWPPQNDRPISAGMVSDHYRTISKCDAILGKALKQYFRAEELLRGALRHYKWLLERFDRPAHMVKWRDPSLEQEVRHTKVAKRAIDLEFRARDLKRAVLRCNETMPENARSVLDFS